MSRTVILDAGVINQINKSNLPVANKLKAMLAPGSGVTVYYSDQAFMELTGLPNAVDWPGKTSGEFGPDLLRSRAAARKMLEDLEAAGLKRAPAPPGGWDNVIKQYAANEKAGNMLSIEDLRTVAQAIYLKAEVWTFDTKTFVNPKNANNLKVSFPSLKIAVESGLPISNKPWDYRVGRTLMGLKPIIVSFHGQISEPPPTGSGGGGGGGGLTAYIGEADMRPIEVGGPNPGGQAMMGGLLLAFQGVQMALNDVVDARNKQAIKDDLTKMGPGIAKNRQTDPSQGVLLVFYFRPGADGPIGTVKGAPFYLYVQDYYGHTEDEAKRSWATTQSPSATEPGVITQTTWVPPLVPAGVDELKTPFRKFALGTFIPGKEVLQDVMWDYTGFDDEGTTKLDVPDGETPQFIILDPPESIKWSDAYGDYTTGVNRIWREAGPPGQGNPKIPVVFLDPDLSFFFFDVAAAMVFPADDDTRDLFEDTPETENGQYLNRLNLSMMRWVRPENIRITSPWDAIGTPGTVLTSVAPRGGGRSRPDPRFIPKASDLAPKEQWGKLLDGPPRVYVVAPNDGLEKIARQVYGDPAKWRLILHANEGKIDPHTSPPYRIYPGQRLIVPDVSKPNSVPSQPQPQPAQPFDPNRPVA